jgi:hypothetical protein
MAREVIEKLIDDLEGGDAAETVTFGLDGASYEIDLSRKNAAALRKALERYITAARRRGGATRRTGGASRPGRRKAPAAKSTGPARPRDYDLAQLREWAGSNGIAVPSRGRIPLAIVEQYRAAGGH